MLRSRMGLHREEQLGDSGAQSLSCVARAKKKSRRGEAAEGKPYDRQIQSRLRRGAASDPKQAKYRVRKRCLEPVHIEDQIRILPVQLDPKLRPRDHDGGWIICHRLYPRREGEGALRERRYGLPKQCRTRRGLDRSAPEVELAGGGRVYLCPGGEALQPCANRCLHLEAQDQGGLGKDSCPPRRGVEPGELMKGKLSGRQPGAFGLAFTGHL